MSKLNLISALLLTCCCVQVAEARTIKHNNSPSAKDQYMVGVLKLALEKSEQVFEVVSVKDSMTDARVKAELETGGVDVYWGPAAKDNIEKFKPIYFPLAKGLLGYRLLLIKQQDQYKFSDISSLAELKLLKAGQGKFWGDTQILTAANIPVVAAAKYESLFYMLEGERFDYFPRAVHEPWSEIEERKELGLAVESDLMLAYPLAMIFYVNKNDALLANALNRGMEKAITDGSFDDYFFRNPLIKTALSRANLSNRTVFRIDNPYLPAELPVDRKELWLDVDSIDHSSLLNITEG